MVHLDEPRAERHCRGTSSVSVLRVIHGRVAESERACKSLESTMENSVVGLALPFLCWILLEETSSKAPAALRDALKLAPTTPGVGCACAFCARLACRRPLLLLGRRLGPFLRRPRLLCPAATRLLLLRRGSPRPPPGLPLPDGGKHRRFRCSAGRLPDAGNSARRTPQFYW